MKHQNNAGFKAGGTGGTKRFTLLPILISYQVPRTPGGADKSYLRKELKNLNSSSITMNQLLLQDAFTFPVGLLSQRGTVFKGIS